MKEKSERLSEEGKTPLFFARDGALCGIIAVADTIKEDSPQAIAEMRNMGIHVVMLTGDNERTAKAIGAKTGVDEVIAGVLPDGKESVICPIAAKRKVTWCGDGINDAPALTSADIGHCHRCWRRRCHRRGGCGADEKPSIRCARGHPLKPCDAAQYS